MAGAAIIVKDYDRSPGGCETIRWLVIRAGVERPAVNLAVMDTSSSQNGCDVSIIVPTYCEAENLPMLVPRIATALQIAQLRGEILVVDDNSPDETGAICETLSQDHPLRLIVRTRDRGLSSAVIEGMNQARGSVLVVVDADLSHPPEKIPELVRAIQADEADFVIGSRYVSGGGTDETWGLFRWLNSKTATWLARPLTSARDPMAGFFALRRSRFSSASTQLDPIGYKIGLELIVKCGCRRIKEIPIFFGNRMRGQSKLSFKEQLNYLRHLKRLYEFRWGSIAQLLQFLTVGATGMLIDLTMFTLGMKIMSPKLARALAIWIAMTWNFWWNRKWTFSQARDRPLTHQYGLFGISCGIGALISWTIFVSLHSFVPFFVAHPLLAAFIGIVASTAVNFLMSKYVAFK